MAKRHYQVRGNFPAQQLDLVEVDVVAGGWPAAIGLAARMMKKAAAMKGKKVRAASFTIEEIKVAATVTAAAEQAPQLAMAAVAEPSDDPGATGA